MNRIILLSIIALVSCKTQPQNDIASQDSMQTNLSITPQQNELTESQKAEGWKLLFDGQSLNGWRFFKNLPNNSWEVKDGLLHCKPFEDGKENFRSDIMTTDQYDNFELSIDWKISPQGNSGIMYRVSEAFDQPYKTGPEYQILDDGGYPGETKETNMTACSYDMYAVTNKKLNPVGEWNTTKIIANGDSVEHWLNGEKVLAYQLNSDDWKKRKSNSKWKDESSYGVIKKGFIDLQDHHHEVWFKNIMIKPLVNP